MMKHLWLFIFEVDTRYVGVGFHQDCWYGALYDQRAAQSNSTRPLEPYSRFLCETIFGARVAVRSYPLYGGFHGLCLFVFLPLSLSLPAAQAGRSEVGCQPRGSCAHRQRRSELPAPVQVLQGGECVWVIALVSEGCCDWLGCCIITR